MAKKTADKTIKSLEIKNYSPAKVRTFLIESNAIEGVYDRQALKDAMKAWKYAVENIDSINRDYVLEIHRLLATTKRPDIAGKVRDCSVWIGGVCKMKEPPLTLKRKIGDWCGESNKIIKSKKYQELDQVKMENVLQELHLDFEGLHPFEDFNGRTGRLLWNIYRLKAGLPILIIHEGDEQQDYYRLFRERAMYEFLKNEAIKK